jgi:hypothetical protein
MACSIAAVDVADVLFIVVMAMFSLQTVSTIACRRRQLFCDLGDDATLEPGR